MKLYDAELKGRSDQLAADRYELMCSDRLAVSRKADQTRLES